MINDENSASRDADEIDYAGDMPSVSDPTRRPADTRAFRPKQADRQASISAAFGKSRRLDIEPATLLEALVHRWQILAIGGGAMLILGLFVSLGIWGRTSYACTVQLGRSDSSAISEIVRPQALATPTLIGMIQSPAVFQKTGARMQPSLSAGQVAARLKVTAERSTDLTTITASAPTPQTAAALANAFCLEAIRFTKDLQSREADEAGAYLGKQLDETETDLVTLRNSVPDSVRSSISSSLPAGKITDKIQAARDELANLLLRYTEAHPLVREQRAKLAALAEQFAASDISGKIGPDTPLNRAGTGNGGNARLPMDYEVVLNRLRTLENNHAELVTRQRLINIFKNSPPGYFRVMIPASPEDAWAHRPWLKIIVFSGFLGLLGLAAGAGEIISRELLDNRLKTGADVKRVTRLPLLATLGDLRRMPSDEQDTWAFRTWISLQDRLGRSPNCGLVCGVTSSLPGDGRSTWVRLLAQAASRCGFRVLTISTSSATNTWTNRDNDNSTETTNAGRPQEESTTITTDVLSTPAEVVEKLSGPDSQPMVHIPLPGWVWNLERRKQWQAALSLWRRIDNIVILVELPPSSIPESVLLAENLPNLIWLSESGRSDAAETRNQLETLRHARSNLVGSVLNRAPDTLLNGRFARWFGCWALLFAILGMAPHPLSAQEAGPPPAAESREDAAPAFSVVAPARRAAWQQRLTLGPGDVLNLSLFGAPELTREEIPVGPDGRISYLEAQNVSAAGLTIDEFREHLGEELAKYRRAPQPIITPAVYRSKKYFVLGKVVQKGVFTLDRPITIIEAVARARGLETGLSDRNLVELADLSRSFLARGGHHMPVNFEKLFLDGDLTQNIPLEPGDYLYFPAGDLKEVYVLGEVFQPGALTFSPDTGALAAIAARGGFTDRAWKKRLLVIRGSLNHPEMFVVNANEVLSAKTADFRLQPKDIVYVSNRPWIRAEELLDTAATAFVESAVVTWTGLRVTPTGR